MNQQLTYGNGATLSFDIPDEAVLADCRFPRITPLDDPAAAVAAALADPLDFPPLAQATVPGDRIVIALDHSVPQADALVAGVVHALLQGETGPQDITIVQAKPQCAGPAEDPRRLLPDEVREVIELVTHDPADTQSQAYLAASKNAKPIYFNRTIHDADVVVPISCLRLESSLGYVGVHGGLFPTFSDEQTQKRFRAPQPAEWLAQQQRRRREADEAAWLLGIQFTVQVVPGPGDTLLHVLAGEAHRVAERGRELCAAAWDYRVSRRANLVVATIEGGPEQQTWDNFARALFTASRVVNDDGALVLCTELQCGPGPALQRLAADFEDDAVQEIRRELPHDALPAALLAEVRKRIRLYLLSGLDESTVEDLGLAHVESAVEIGRLSRHFDSCILLGNAQHAAMTPQED